MSNNSIDADSFEQISNDIWSGFDGNGEAYGFINMNLARNQGRLGEKIKDDVEGVNPCAEANLADKEPCDLAEVFLNNIESKEELIRCALLLYKTQKAALTLPALYKETEKIATGKTLMVNSSNHKIISIMKLERGFASMDDLVSYLLECEQKIKALELEQLKKQEKNGKQKRR